MRLEGTGVDAVMDSQRPLARSLGGEEAASGVVQASDGIELRYLRWSSEQREVWAALVFLHGIASHAGWFGETASDLASKGVAVYGPDRRGSGRSGGRRGHLARYERAIDDIDDVIGVVAPEQQGKPLFLAASSWAAKLGLVYSARRAARFSGLVLLGPGLFPRINLTFARQLGVVVGHTIAPTARIRIPLTPEMYTTDPRYLDAIRMDPLRLLTATSRFFWETARLDRHRSQASSRLLVPLLLLQGEDDVMMDVPKTRHWFDGLDLDDKTYIGYPGSGHTLDFGPARVHYVADMVPWMSARVPSRPPDQAAGPA
jgi:alpha-beta hydrolase superfamily lysophospholipase